MSNHPRHAEPLGFFMSFCNANEALFHHTLHKELQKLKKQAERIVLISGDSDFVPAAKFARREGIDFILDPMWLKIPDDLFEHIDGLRSTCPNPKNTPIVKAKKMG